MNAAAPQGNEMGMTRTRSSSAERRLGHRGPVGLGVVVVAVALGVLSASPARADDAGASGVRPGARVKERSESIVRAMSSNADGVRRVLAEARRKNDRGATQCADQALSRANTAVRLGRERALLAQSAAGAGNDDEAGRQLRLLDDLYVEQAKVARGARSCVSEAAATRAGAGGQSVRVDVDPSIPKVTAAPPR